MDWPDYEKAIRRAANAETIPDRLEVLSRTRRLLDGTTFDNLGTIERRAIAGMVDQEQAERASLGQLDWKLCGSMLGTGEFQKRINANNPRISAALDHIPPQGEVTKDQFGLYCKEFQRAFQSADRQPLVASITRLPALKRPDYFVCLDTRNRAGLGRDIGFAHTTLDVARYWDVVVEPLMQTKWWRAERPQGQSGQSGQLWDGRVAMIDVVYYDE